MLSARNASLSTSTWSRMHWQQQCASTFKLIMRYLMCCLSFIGWWLDVFLQGWMKCEYVECGLRTRRLSLVFAKGSPVCYQCRKGFLIPEVSSLCQKLFWRANFDFSDNNYLWLFLRAVHGHHALWSAVFLPLLLGWQSVLRWNQQPTVLNSVLTISFVISDREKSPLKSTVEYFINHSSYSLVDLKKLFVGLFVWNVCCVE
jgi:hypothetical protein